MHPHDPTDDPSGAPEQFHTAGAALRTLCRRTPREAFEREHPGPWLVRELTTGAQKEPSFATAYAGGGGAPAGEMALVRRIALAPEAFAFYPLAKSGKNPWKDRILIGRATNNDVVLRDASVSKVHARALQRDGQWVVTDAGSTNGTWADGVPVAGATPSAPLRPPVVLTFGSVRCTLLSSAQLHEALSA